MPTTPGTYKIQVFPWDGDGTGGTFNVYLSRGDFGPSPFGVDKSPDIQTLPADGNVMFTVAVSNVGETDIRETAVTDPVTPGCARTATQVRALLNSKGNAVGFRLTPGESFTYTCSVSSITETFTNTATATGKVDGVVFQHADSAEVVDTNPGITVDKSPDVQALPADGIVSFTIAVTNTGVVDLRKTAVTDAVIPGCSRTAAEVRALLNGKGNPVGFKLKPAETFTYTCSVTSVVSPFSNTAAAQGVADGVSIQHSDTAEVTTTNPGIDIEKTPDTQPVPGDGTATFTITVINVTDVNLRQTAVDDANTPACGRTAAQVRALLNSHGNPVGFLLKPGESFTYTCEATGITETFTNTAAARGIADNVSIQDSDTATIQDPPP